ncbi:acyl-homoserine-lactone synthase [Rhodopseudomonas parapalustris]
MLKVISGREAERYSNVMEKAYRFRHSIFVEEKGWSDLRRPDGLERDCFDGINAVHQICMRGCDVVGYQRLLPTTQPHLLTEVLGDLCRRQPPRGPNIYEWTRFCVTHGRREMRPRGDSPFLELAQGVVEWGMANGVDTVSAVIDWRLMVIAMQLRFFVRPLGLPKRIGDDEVVALEMSFDAETLDALHVARGCASSVLEDMPIASAA